MTDPLALGAVVAYCGWDPTVAVTDVTVNLDGDGSTLLTLPSLHVTAVATVVVTDQWGNSSTFSATVGSDPFGLGLFGTGGFGVGDSWPGGRKVSWSENGLLTWDGLGGWPEGSGNVVVTYSGGYDPTPDDLAAVLTSIGKRTGGVLFGVQSTRMGQSSVAFGAQHAAGGLLTVEQLVLDRYRIPRAK